MKTLQLLLLAAVFLFSCNQNEEEDAVADYKVLGVTSVIINGQEFDVTSGVLLNVAGTSSVAADGILVQAARTQVSYVVLTTKGSTPSVEVRSSYADVSVSVSDVTTAGHRSYTVQVRREGFQEQITYVFNFIELE
jgi:hypothetical protein